MCKEDCVLCFDGEHGFLFFLASLLLFITISTDEEKSGSRDSVIDEKVYHS